MNESLAVNIRLAIRECERAVAQAFEDLRTALQVATLQDDMPPDEPAVPSHPLANLRSGAFVSHWCLATRVDGVWRQREERYDSHAAAFRAARELAPTVGHVQVREVRGSVTLIVGTVIR